MMIRNYNVFTTEEEKKGYEFVLSRKDHDLRSFIMEQGYVLLDLLEPSIREVISIKVLRETRRNWIEPCVW